MSLHATKPCMMALTAGADMKTGSVKWFNDVKGFGFISVDGEEDDLFVHQSEIHAEGFRSLADDEKVEFVIGEDRGKYAAGPRPLDLCPNAARAPPPRTLLTQSHPSQAARDVCDRAAGRLRAGPPPPGALLIVWRCCTLVNDCGLCTGSHLGSRATTPRPVRVYNMGCERHGGARGAVACGFMDARFAKWALCTSGSTAEG